MISPDVFFVPDGDTVEIDPWTQVRTPRLRFDLATVENLRAGSAGGLSDIEAALALTGLVHTDLETYGTGGEGGTRLTEEQFVLALLTLRAVLKRLGVVDFDPPYRSFSTFRSYWMRSGASGSWQARRDLLNELFEPLHLRLIRIEEQTFDALAGAVTPHAELGWPLVDEEIRELRRRFQTATTPQDYRALGTNCVGVLEALGRTVYDAGRHLREGETVPPVDKTKMRIGRYVEDALPGERNADVRGLTNKAVDLAHHVKHSPTSTRREAGISADSVILLANILRRLEQDL